MCNQHTGESRSAPDRPRALADSPPYLRTGLLAIRSGAEDLPAGPSGLQVASLAGLTAVAAIHWASLVTSPPIGLIVLAAAPSALLGLAVRAWGRRHGFVAPGIALATIAMIAAAFIGLVLTGLEGRLLVPGNHDELARMVHAGARDLVDARYPFRAPTEEARLVVLLPFPVIAALAWFCACAPTARLQRARPAAAAALLLGAYGVAMTLYSPEAPLMHGALAFLLVAGWLTRPSSSPPSFLAPAAILASATAIAVPAASALDGERPWVDYTRWSDSELEADLRFDWDHDYGDIDWTRTGAEVLQIEAEQPYYWRAVVLDHFDGRAWVRSHGAPVSLEPPTQIQPFRGAAPVPIDESAVLELPSRVEPSTTLDPRWVTRSSITVGALNSIYVVAPGTPLEISGIDAGLSPDGTAVATTGIARGDHYEVVSYAPRPTAAELRAAGDEYPVALAPYTTINVPVEPRVAVNPASPIEITVRTSIGPGLGAPVPAAVMDSPYARLAALSARLTENAAGPLEAARAIERYLERTAAYSETTGEHDFPLAAFVLRDGRGFCQQFSGAMALMLRLSGIPARVASGFATGEVLGRGETGSYSVTDLDAHSWVEVYFNGIGWVTFDPTPPGTPAATELARDLGSAPASAATVGPEVRAQTPPQLERSEQAPAPEGSPSEEGTGLLVWLVLGAAVALMIGLVALTRLRARRYARLGAAAAGEAQAEELARMVRRAGYEVPGGATLRELEAKLERLGYRRGARYAAALREARYAREAALPPGLRARRAVRSELAAGLRPRARLWLLAGMPPGGPRIS